VRSCSSTRVSASSIAFASIGIVQPAGTSPSSGNEYTSRLASCEHVAIRRSTNGAGYSQFHEVSVSCSGGPATGAPLGKRDRDAEEDPVIARVDRAVVIRVGEELHDVERATVLRERGLPRLSGELKDDLCRLRRRGRRQREGFEALRGMGGERRTHAPYRPRDRDVNEPAPVGRDGRARHVPIEERPRRKGSTRS
jgi:hypothetical protein